jgi:hypothetical protein
MPEHTWLQREPMPGLIKDLAASAASRYRITVGEAEDVIRNVFVKDTDLRSLVESGRLESKVSRTRAFKRAATNAKRRIYYRLRRYTLAAADQEAGITALVAKLQRAGSAKDAKEIALEIAKLHVSTRERLKHLDEFYRCLFSTIGAGKTILDVGCGMQPLLFPFEGLGQAVERYVATDKDPTVIAAVDAYRKATGNDRLIPLRWDIRSGWASLSGSCGMTRFDVVFLFKLVPVLQRQDRSLLGDLLRTPADLWVVTGSKMSMTRRESIERRERRVLRGFCEMTHREIIAELDVGPEFGVVLGSRAGAEGR